jgi:hypothetical protein
MSADACPLPEDFQEPLLQSLALLASTKAAGTAWLTASQIASALLSAHGLSLHWKTIQTMLSDNGGYAARRKRNNKWEFTITGPGKEQVSSGTNPILFIHPTKAVRAVFTLHEFFGTLRKTLRICDPYLDAITLRHIDACTAATSIRLLTFHITDTPTLRLALSAFASQGKQVEVRKPVLDILHDRYMIDESSMLILGTSLNSFGKKQCFVIKAGQDIRSALLDNFNTLWNSAAPWP